MMRPSSAQRRFHPEVAFGGFTELDGTVRFYARVQELLAPETVALDIGCGRGTQAEDPVRVRRELRTLRGRCRLVIGIDVDPQAATNPSVDDFHLIAPGRPWPIDEQSIDLAIADFVVEHVTDPDHFFGPAARVIRPGGVICIRTINAHGYVALLSRLVPQRLHGAVLRRAQPHRPSEDVFPTVYRCNTRRRLAQALDGHGFDAVVYGSEDEPAYFGFSQFLYGLGLAHRRWAPHGLRVALIALAQRR